MQGSAQRPPGAALASKSWLPKMPTNQRPGSATSLSFPTKPPGAHQVSNPSNGAGQASQAQLHHRQVDLHHPHHHHHHRPYHPHRRTVSAFPSSVHISTLHEEDKIAVYGLHSFGIYCDSDNDLYFNDRNHQLPPDPDFAYFLDDTLTKHDLHDGRIYTVPILSAPPTHRSLTLNAAASNYEMTTTTTTAPNSPPDLTRSKSSKSSSLQSSQFGGAEDITNDASHFEEIGLDGDTLGSEAEPVQWQENRYAKRSRSGASMIRSQPSIPALQATDGNKRPTYPSLHGQVQNALRRKGPSPSGLSQNSQPPIGLRRGFTAPATATFPLPTSNHFTRTRSSSPSPHLPASAPYTTTSRTPRYPPTSRRASTQANRKSAQELEDEYHDSDDELPEDASLWNVPMSPRPPIARPSSTRTSTNGSPERESTAEMPRPIPLSHATSAPESPPRHPLSQSLPRVRPPPRTSSLQTSTSTASSPTSSTSHQFFKDSRAKSWTLAMADLSEEAQVLTETLEFHEDNKDKMHEEKVQNGIKSSRSSMASSRRSARSSTIELPPIQKGNILIDPMPLSKEKEAVLTRTRPSWLPPKDPKEEKRHLREYQKMMAASIDAEKRKSERIKVEQCEKDDTRDALNRVWEQYVCPEWDKVSHEHRTRELWWRGISPKVRGQVWARAVGNPLGLTHKSYTRALQRVTELHAKPVDALGPKERTVLAWISDIERDASTAFTELNLFHHKGPLWQQLVDVCSAYASYRSDVGYLYGIQLIAALILLQLPDPADAFMLLANVLNRPMALAFLTNDPGHTARYLEQVSSALQYKFPRLHHYLFAPTSKGGLAIHTAEVFEIPFWTLLTNGLDVERLVRVWDCFVFEGDRIITRSAVALLGCLQAQIFGIEGEVEEKRKLVTDMLSWGAVGRAPSGYWDVRGDVESFMGEVREAGKVNHEA